ncbi:pyrroloquinoline quinone biosynthesis peptide chaperone PqqD [Methylophaga thalassica]|uniref:pyrroloquinoline quinone biosynthesis peptide chaperone PqqD n=1 Tax=Methylophaga thalassica TaxID=40223 RepID=UPI003611CEAA
MTDRIFNADTIPVLALGYRFQWEPAQDCYVLLYPEGMVKLNPAAGEILKRVSEKSKLSASSSLNLKKPLMALT